MEQNKQRIVVKVGTSTLTHNSGALALWSMEHLVRTLADLQGMGHEVILVSSGAIAVGTAKLGLSERPKELRMKQAAAAVGQCRMMHIYDKFFSEYNRSMAQILRTGDDVEDPERAEHLSNTFSALLEKGAAVTVGNVYEPFLGACHRFDIFVDRLLDGYTVAEASWMSMPVLSWQGLVFGDPLYRPYARMKDMDVEPTEEDRYFQGWWASSVQFGDRWKDRSARLMESARKAPFSCLYEALALECLYRKEPARAGELLSSALDGAADARTRARLLLEILMAERARGGNKAFLQRADGIRGLMSSSAFLPALEEWLARVAPPPDPPEK